MASLITPTQVNDIVNNLPAANFDLNLIPEQYIYDAQRLWLKPFLREELYDDFITNYSETKYTNLLDGETGYTYGGYTYNYDGIKYALACYSMIQALPFMQKQIRKAGVEVNNADFSTPATDNEIASLRGSLITKAQFYLNATVDYLNRNTSTYTLWWNKGVQTKIVGGIVMPNNPTKYHPEDPRNIVQ